MACLIVVLVFRASKAKCLTDDGIDLAIILILVPLIVLGTRRAFFLYCSFHDVKRKKVYLAEATKIFINVGSAEDIMQHA